MTIQTRIPLLYGAGNIGKPGTYCKIESAEAAQPLISAFAKGLGQETAVDTSSLYGFGSSEENLNACDLHGLKIDTKLYPLHAGDFERDRFRELFRGTLERNFKHKIRVFYLHAPDHTVAYEEYLEVVDEFYRAGHFEFFGLSNYKAYEVSAISEITRARGWVVPTVYEGLYNPIDRSVETELIPCLRKYKIRFSAYTPLAGGFLVGIYLDKSPQDREAGSHFDLNLPFGSWYDERYMPTVGAVKKLKAKCEEHRLNLQQASTRWMQHHSAMVPSDLGIIIASSKIYQIEEALKYHQEGELPAEVVKAFETTWKEVRGGISNYHHDPAWYDPKSHGYGQTFEAPKM